MLTYLTFYISDVQIEAHHELHQSTAFILRPPIQLNQLSKNCTHLNEVSLIDLPRHEVVCDAHALPTEGAAVIQ